MQAFDPTAPLDLTAIERRVLGCLLEKEATTPGQYPLTTKALQTACNQTTKRDPVVSYTSTQVDQTVKDLRAAGLARTVHTAGARVDKHRHVLDEALSLSSADLSLLGVLMLVGPQTSGELRTRSERAHSFPDLAAVDAQLAGLAGRRPPLVVEAARMPGQHQQRWIALLGDAPDHADVVVSSSDPGTSQPSAHATTADVGRSHIEATRAVTAGRPAQEVAASQAALDAALARVASLEERLERMESELGL